MRYSYDQDNLHQIPLQQLQNSFHIEFVDGESLPYGGYIETEVYLPDFNHHQDCIFLIVPYHSHHQKVPLLNGIKYMILVISHL